jgi:hypothetical protein
MAGFLNQKLYISESLKNFDRMRSHGFYGLLLIVAIFLISSISIGEKVEYCYDHPTSNAGWSDNATISKFDPELGELISAKLSISYIPNYNLKITNQGNSSANVTFAALGNLSLTQPNKTILVLSSRENRTVLLNPSEEISLNESNNESRLYAIESLEDFLGSSSGDYIVLPVSVTTLSSIRSDEVIMTRIIPQANASICIIYEYSPSVRREG